MSNPTDLFIHEQAICLPSQVGTGTSVSAFVRLKTLARVGEDCCIFDHVVIGDNVIIGDRVVVKRDVEIFDGVTIGDRALDVSDNLSDRIDFSPWVHCGFTGYAEIHKTARS
ncbi:hypothetical protein [Pseudomonas chlororaphis]|uniref:hypothetical protein n=1 Tax=Pseudomonas chlororaphis TaxID=587753 RepID=UPI0013DE5916|nr:hypothetical protein [Pseudomonas chlororaphis]